MVEKTRCTTAEFLEWSGLPQHRDRLFELIDGEIVEKVASFTPSQIAVQVATFLNLYLMQNRIGYITGADGSYILSDENTFMPDVGCISKARMPERPPREVPMLPDLAVEVKSPTDSKRELRRKAEKYLAAGTQAVWLIFPDERQVEVYLPEGDVIELGVNDMLNGGDVLPDFSLIVGELFVD